MTPRNAMFTKRISRQVLAESGSASRQAEIVRRFSSADLFLDSTELVIEHRGSRYLLIELPDGNLRLREIGGLQRHA